MLQNLLFVLPLVVAVFGQNGRYGGPQSLSANSFPLASQANLPAPFSVTHRVLADQHVVNTSYPIVPGQYLEPGVEYEPHLMFVRKPAVPNVTALRDPAPVQPAVTPQPVATPQPTYVVPPTQTIPQRPAIVLSTPPPQNLSVNSFPLASQANLPAPFSVTHRVLADQHVVNTSYPIVPGQYLEPGVEYEPHLMFVRKPVVPNVTALRDPAPVQPAVTPQPVATPQPTYVVPPTQTIPQRPAIVLSTPPPTLPLRPAPPTLPSQTSPVYIVTPRPTGLFKTEFQCPESNGLFSVPNSCDAYYECKGFLAERRLCPNGWYFNPAARYYASSPCASSSEVMCMAGGNVVPRPTPGPKPGPDPAGQCPTDGLFGIIDGDCSRFYSCDHGIARIMDCPAGLVFNDQLKVCDWPVNVPQCTPNVLKDFTCPAPPVERNGEASDIVYNYRYRSQCRSFVACQKGRPRLLSCDPGLAFDDASQTCVSESLVQNCATSYAAAAA
ncbi:unnamed protein product [Chrysodeixis includens]|uniref:Chitin-binding type-2 domain-containing protein n=1 Tax=Chrysodeixis includens TaxID=689277 RepID=A0A9N8KZI4_CHRIL|nr:unnamed protein product [Chrysodeixis includens]